MGITSEDRSRVLLSDALSLKSRVGIRLSQKQAGYEEAYASLQPGEHPGAETPYAAGENSRLVVDGKAFGE